MKDFSYSTVVGAMIISDEYRDNWRNQQSKRVRGLDFRDTSFIFSRVVSSMFMGADLSGADFSGADISGTGFVQGCRGDSVYMNRQTRFFDGEMLTEKRLKENRQMWWMDFKWRDGGPICGSRFRG